VRSGPSSSLKEGQSKRSGLPTCLQRRVCAGWHSRGGHLRGERRTAGVRPPSPFQRRWKGGQGTRRALHVHFPGGAGRVSALHLPANTHARAQRERERARAREREREREREKEILATLSPHPVILCVAPEGVLHFRSYTLLRPALERCRLTSTLLPRVCIAVVLADHVIT
jgi:hypothetical protein